MMGIGRKLKKRVFCLILAVAFLMVNAAITVPKEVFAENNASDVEYIPERQKYAIIPGSLYADKDFYNSLVKTDAVWAFNSITYFTDNKITGGIINGDIINYSTERVGYNASFSRNLQDFDPVLEKLRKKGDLLVNFRVSLANNGLYRQIAGLRYIEEYMGYQTSSEYVVYGDREYIKHKGASIELYYQSTAANQGSRMKNSSLAFADATPPKMQEIFASSDIDGLNVTNLFNTGSSTIYLHVRFDENIRFSDNNRKSDNTPASHNNIYLNLKIQTIGGSTIDDACQKARLVRLKGDTLTFRYDIPIDILGDDVNHCITGITGIVDEDKGGQSALNSDYPLRVLTHTGELYGHYTSNGLVTYKSRSLITDAAGNPADTGLVSPKKPVYIDKISPYITTVSFDAPENRSGFVGPGNKITPSVTFNEPICAYYRINNFAPIDSPRSFVAYLNVKDQWGGNIFVYGSSFSSDGKVLEFDPVTLQEGMTLDEGETFIEIKSISMHNNYDVLRPGDLRGNALAQTIVSFPDEPANKFKPDAVKPVIATGLPVTAGSKYMPIPYDSDGDLKNDSFYFSFGISDTGSGADPKKDITLKGSFKWVLNGSNNAGIDINKLSFKYTFTDSDERPAADKTWYTGGLSNFYYFTQRGRSDGDPDNIYLHVKAAGLEGANLDESTLTITAKDLVGNNETKSFILDGGDLNSMLDRTPPHITEKKMYAYKEDTAGGGKWKFAAQFTLEDISKVDSENVYVKWVDKTKVPAEDPAEVEWTKVTGLGPNAETVPVTVDCELDDGVMNSRDLYIKAYDCSINANILEAGPFAFVRDLTKPVFEYSYSDEMTTKAALVIEAAAQSFTDTIGGVSQEIPAVILVTAGNSYKAVELTTGASADFFDGGDGWYNTENGDPSDDSTLNSILSGTYYGKIDVRVDIGYGICYSGGVVQTQPYSQLTTEYYTLYTAPSLDPIHDITMTSSLAAPPGGWNSPADGPEYYTSIAGATFNVVVNNARMEEWGSKDVDFENSFFGIYSEGGGTPVFTAPIGMTSTIAIPESLILPDGGYYAKATVTAKTSGHVDESNNFEFQIDTTQPEDFGLSSTETLWQPSGSPVDPDVAALFGKIGTDTVYYGYDSVHNSGVESYKDIPSVFLGSGDNGLAVPVRKLYFTTKSANNEFYIKVWNATEGVDEEQSKAMARWQHIGSTADAGGGAGFASLVVGGAADIVASYSAGVIPVINNTENIIKYQLCHANGTVSGEKQLLAQVSDEMPQLEVALAPDTQPSTEVTAKVTRLYSSSDIDLKVFYWAGGSAGDPVDVGAAADENGNISLLQEDSNWFYTANIYGNYAILNKQAANLDKDAPVLTSTPFLQDGDMYQFTATIKDKNSWDLFMKFDDTYMARLGLSGYFRLEVPHLEESETEGTWIADSPRSDGIYKIVRTDSPDGTVNLSVTGVYLYDDGGGSPPATVSVAYSLYARDTVGNESGLNVAASPVRNARLELTLGETTVAETVSYTTALTPSNLNSDGTMDLYSMRASFNLPVKNVTPLQHHRAENSYGLIKDFLNIFRDGTYTVTYDDIFGRSYREERTVAVNNDMIISMTGLDAEDKYELYAEPAENEGKFLLAHEGKAFLVFADIYDASLTSGTVRAFTAKRAVMQFSRNETAIISMMVYRPAWNGWFLDGSIPLILIDGSTRTAPAAEVHWYYHEFASDTLPAGETETDGNVDVRITSDTPITGINGKLLSHTFTYGDEESYVFEYANSEGITGSIAVTLPIPIVQNKEHQGGGQYFNDDGLGINEDDLYKTPPDTTPPGVIFTIYGSYGSSMNAKGKWYSGSSDELKDLFTWAGTFVLKANIIDDSKTETILLRGVSPDIGGISYGNAQCDVIQGAALEGDNIRVTAQVSGQGADPATASVTYPEAFTVLIIDEAGNKTAIPFPATLWDQLDVIAPWLYELSYTKTDFTKVEAAFKLKDDKTPDGQVMLLSPSSLTYDAVTGIYTMTFSENKEVQASLRDLAGNVGSATLKVDILDDQPPSVVSVWYSKGYVGDNGVYDPERLTVEKTNQTIVAKLVFNKPVNNVALSNVRGNNYDALPSGADPSDYVTMSWDTDSVTLEFLQNAYASLTYTALNGKSNTYDISVYDIIDKSIPHITVDKSDNTTDTYATVTFSNPVDTGEPVRVYGPGETGKQLFEPGEVMTKTFVNKGTYIFRFIDEAGNTRTENVKIENIDEFPPGILLADLPPTGTYYNDSITFKATMSEAGTLTFNNVSIVVAAPDDLNGNGRIDADVNGNGKVDTEDNECDWHTFTATQNGNFPITAVDAAGRKTTAYVAISCFDKAGPVISFDPVTITVMSGTDAASFLAVLEQGVTVTDNSTAAGDIALIHEDPAVVDLSIPGKYQVAFTAADRAGNTTVTKRYVKVFSASEISVSVNGKRTESRETTVLYDSQVALEVSKLPMGDNEPYKIYLRKGIWTAGEMKDTAPLAHTGSFTLPDRDSFYTLYIVTQNRGTYLTYLYLQD